MWLVGGLKRGWLFTNYEYAKTLSEAHGFILRELSEINEPIHYFRGIELKWGFYGGRRRTVAGVSSYMFSSLVTGFKSQVDFGMGRIRLPISRRDYNRNIKEIHKVVGDYLLGNIGRTQHFDKDLQDILDDRFKDLYFKGEESTGNN